MRNRGMYVSVLVDLKELKRYRSDKGMLRRKKEGGNRMLDFLSQMSIF